jgi:hypothetical protein
MKKGNNTDKDGVCTSETTTVEGRHQEQNCFIDEEVNGTTINKKKKQLWFRAPVMSHSETNDCRKTYEVQLCFGGQIVGTKP